MKKYTPRYSINSFIQSHINFLFHIVSAFCPPGRKLSSKSELFCISKHYGYMVSSPRQGERKDPFFIMEAICIGQIKRKEEYNIKD